MNSPRYAPAGLLVEQGRVRVVIDGGPGADPAGPLAAWLVTDERHGVRRLVFAHIGRPAIATLDAGHVPPFGEIGTQGGVYTAG